MTGLIAVTLLHLSAGATLTLDDALSLAVKRNAELEIARTQEQASVVGVSQAYQGVLPRLDLTGAFGRQFQGAQQQVQVVPNPTPPPDFVRLPTSYPANDFGVYQLGLNLTWTFFDGFATWNGVAAARNRASSAHRQYDESALQLAFDVTRRFYEVVKQQRVLEVRRETVALSEDLVKRSDALFQAGRGTKADTYAARVNLGNDRLALEAQTAVLTRARTDLAVVLGLTSEAGLEVVPPEPVATTGAPARQELPSVAALTSTARKKRPLIEARRLAGEAADLDIARARGGYWPAVGLQAGFQKMSPELTGSFGLLGDPSKQYVATLQATLTWNLFAGFETRNAVRLAEVESHRSEALLQQAEQVVAAEVAAAHDQVVALDQSVDTARQVLDAAENAHRFAREQLDARIATQLEVRDAALKLAQAKLTWVGTLVDLAVARADLNRAVGGAL